MGVDLAVSPITYSNLDSWLCYNRIGFERDYSLFTQIGGPDDNPLILRGHEPLFRLRSLPIPPCKRIQWYNDEGIRTMTEGPYGCPLTWLPAGEFTKITMSEETSRWNAAVITFLRAMPPDTPVVLWWH